MHDGCVKMSGFSRRVRTLRTARSSNADLKFDKMSEYCGIAKFGVSRRTAAAHLLAIGASPLVFAAPSLTHSCELRGASLDAALRGAKLFAIQGDSPLILTSGDPAFDKALGRQLVRLSKTFGVRPGFAFVDDAPSPNAAASRESRLPGTSGTVLFGLMLLKALMDGGPGAEIAVLGICAHEFAHIHQFQTGYDRKLSAGSSTVKLVELHADFLAGYFVGQLKLERPQITLKFFGKKLYGMGTYNSSHPDFHGTPAERLSSAEAGAALASSKSPFVDISQSGYRYVFDQFGGKS